MKRLLSCALVLGAGGCNDVANWCQALSDLRDKEANCPVVLDAGLPYNDAGFIFVGCEQILTSAICQPPEREALSAAGRCLSSLPTCGAGEDASYQRSVNACLAGNSDGGAAGDAGSVVPALSAVCASNLESVGAL